MCYALLFCCICGSSVSAGSAFTDTEGQLRDLNIHEYGGMTVYIVPHLHKNNVYIPYILSNFDATVTDVVIFKFFSYNL